MQPVGNLMSEQIDSNGNIIIDKDQKIVGINNTLELLQKYLGTSTCFKKRINGKNHIVYTPENNSKEILLLTAAITYMGGNGNITKHPPYLKRIQLKQYWKDIYTELYNEYDVRFLGIYTYEDTFIFTDLVKDTYLERKMHNSSAHIYTNDLVKAFNNKLFKRIDENNNTIISISSEYIKEYLDGEHKIDYDYEFFIFKEFNKDIFNTPRLYAINAIKEMYNNDFTHWKQGEWAGWYLEYRFNNFIKLNNIKDVNYSKYDNLNSFEYDFDLWLGYLDHFGDLKASDDKSREVLGNDLTVVENVINKYGKLWYVVYEHETERDRDHDFEQTIKRTNFILEEGHWGSKPFDPLSYKTKMKHSVLYNNMFILELTKDNFKHYTTIFKQGKQQDGSKRNHKIKFSKHQIQNAIIFSERNDLNDKPLYESKKFKIDL